MLRLRAAFPALLLPAAALLAAPAVAPAATAFYGVTATNQLVEFQSDNTAQVPAKAIRNLAEGELIKGLDVRPKDGRLYAVTNRNRIVVINPRNAAATYVGDAAITPALTGDRVAFDFNPLVDLIRVETDAAQNLRINPDTGQLQRITVAPPQGEPAPTTPQTTPGQPDGNLQYAAGDPAAGVAPQITAAAYTNTFPIGTTTELFGLDRGRNTLTKQDPPNAGTLKTVGGLGTTGEPIAFDIAEGNAGYAAITRPGGGSTVGLYRVNLGSGAATPVGARFSIGSREPLVALASAGEIANDTSNPRVSVACSSTQLRSRLLEGGVQLTVAANEAVTGDATVTRNGRTAGTADVEVSGGAGYDRVTVDLNSATRNAIRSGSVALRLRVEVADGAGNRSVLTRTIRTR